MAASAAKPQYIRYNFPSQSATPPDVSSTPAQATRNIDQQRLPPAVSNGSSLDLGPEFDPASDGVVVPTSASSKRVREWIDHNTGEDGGSSGDWHNAVDASAKSRRQAHRVRTHKERRTSFTQQRNVHRRSSEDVTDGTTSRHHVSVAVELTFEPPDAVELNANLSERIHRNAIGQQGTVTANTEDIFHHRPQKNLAIRKYVEEASSPAQPGTWQALPEIPRSNEVMFTPPDNGVPRNKIEGAWDSKEDYLKAHYSLLREDAVFPMRSTVHQVREYPTAQEDYFNGSIGMYDRVRIVGLTTDIRGIALRVSFSLSRIGKRVKWEQSKRLISGTMVALTPASDMFQEKCVIATVAARALSNLQEPPPQIDLYLSRASELEIDPSIEWVMVEERSAYFEASRHVLTALQKLSREPFPLQEHLVDVETKVSMPLYIQNHSILDMSTAFEDTVDASYENVDVVNDWPRKPNTSLDSSQLTALRRILAKRLAIIQGPPGTGKTHVSVVALKVMLANWQPGDPPIIVSCQTNHALDQLLRHVAEFEKQFVRLGGRSKDQGVVKERTLYELRRAKNRPPEAGGLKATSMVRMKGVGDTISGLLAPFATGTKVLLEPEVFKRLGLLTEAQCKSLEEGDKEWVDHNAQSRATDDLITEWLGTQLQIVTRQVHPDDLAYDYEDADMESEAVLEMEAEAKVADEDFTDELRGRFYSINDNYTGKRLSHFTDAEAEATLRKSQSMYRIPLKQRGSVYCYLIRQVKQRLVTAIREETRKYNDLAKQRQIGAWEHDLSIIREQKLVGTTTTGLSKYRPLISALKPRVVLIEEAAETIEAPVAVACVPSLEHLIMVGDHQQLRPQCSVKHFEGVPFNLNVSLFERMVLNNVEFQVITRQRRMIPEVRRLLTPIYGAGTIKDHPLVKSAEHRPPIPGMGGINSYFFTHEWPETRDENMSACNVREAEMLVAFFDYLVLNGIPADNITVMTFYNGQRKALAKAFRKHPSLSGRYYNIVTVDSYQGEQNDVILLSLTRSNDTYSIGFLNVVNRICVALSRAKRGFYLFGNAEILCAQNNTWADVVSIMVGQEGEKCPEPKKRVGFYLPLKCEKHGRPILAEEVDDFASINGGCTLVCGGSLPCGHPCELKCHPFAHEEVVCSQPCTKTADCGHPCAGLCCEGCRCNICKDEEEIDPVEDMALSLRKLAASGVAIPRSYGLSGTTVVNERFGGGRASSPSAWNTYAAVGVEAHDRRLFANPERTFYEWDAKTANKSISLPSRSTRSRPSYQSATVIKQHMLRNVLTTDVEKAAKFGYEQRVVEIIDDDSEPIVERLQAVIDEPRRKSSVDLIDFD